MHIDFETYSPAGYWWDAAANRWKPMAANKPGIKGVGAWAYTRHPDAEIISLAVDGVTLWVPGMPPPAGLFAHLAGGGLVWAWNSFFEYCAWNNIAVRLHGWPPLALESLRCGMSRARAWGLPGPLEKAGIALGLDDDNLKDSSGKGLKRKLTIPRSPTAAQIKTNQSAGMSFLPGVPPPPSVPLKDVNRATWENSPEDFVAFFRYNLQDTISERAITQRTPALSPLEEQLWLLDQRINARGCHIDRAGLDDCTAVFQQAEAQYTQELRDLTGNKKQTVNELQKIQDWLAGRGVQTASLDAGHVTALLTRQDLPTDCQRVLEIRQTLGSASVKKLFSIARHLDPDDDRIRGIFAYCGADRTGRFAGMGPQPHNMPASGPAVRVCDCGGIQWAGLPVCRNCHQVMPPGNADWGIEAVELALDDISTRDLAHVERWWGDPLDVISGCLRGLFTAAPGMELICSDYSAIEAVVLACLAGEEWRVEVFRTHGKIYEMSASKISGVPFDEIMAYKKEHGQHHPLRKKIGKVAELASGYGGWIGAWKAFGADKFMDDGEIKNAILAWRDASPAIVEFWGGQHRQIGSSWDFRPEFYGLEGAAISAVLSPGTCYACRSISYGVKDDVLYCRLPSGRRLAYHQPRLERGVDPRGLEVWKLSFMGYNTNAAKGRPGWVRIETYSGKLTENVVQAVARDILTEAMPRLEAAGYPIVLHVHDEVVAEVPAGYGSIEEFESLMMARPDWAADWPIKAAGGWRGYRYRK